MILHNIFVDIGLKKNYKEVEIYKSFYDINNKYYKIKVWDEEMLDKLILKYPKYISLYNSFPHKFYKIDFMRPIILHSEGGFYMDMDNYLTEPLKEDEDFYIGRYKNEIANDFMYFKDKKKYLEIADFYMSRSKSCKMPMNWTVRRLQFICGQKSFSRFCKLDGLVYPKQIPYKFKYTSAWLDAFNKKRR